MEKDKIRLRPATHEDIGPLAAVAGKIFRETYLGKMSTDDLDDYISVAFSIDAISAALREPQSRTIMAFYDDELTGYAKLSTGNAPDSLLYREALQIERLYVLKAWHRRMIGAFLMQWCLQYAASQGLPTVWLAVWERNTDAIRFYQRWGFEIFDAQLFMRGNDPQTGLLMKKICQLDQLAKVGS
ncbi:MAG TPA: GNAT family N-acetyltransferase [Chitinophaga sp.]|uniref:GNAT family N-acetyltransferase n=1 Tax=Chitinophaga sp. TaxID=1869181 RepID=UPI002C883EB5|nr:GNAT family N-acetyltransferase [Chitinophaga sp.]HVI46401.1 GNAT family N-acetyltransferase [Chitinophaga sp.]